MGKVTQGMRARVETPDAGQWRAVDEQLGAYGFTRMERALVDLVGGSFAAVRTAVRGEGSRG